MRSSDDAPVASDQPAASGQPVASGQPAAREQAVASGAPSSNGQPTSGEPLGAGGQAGDREQQGAGDETGAGDATGAAGGGQSRPPGRWRLWRPWLSLMAKPARRVALLFILALVIEYLVVPELVGASKDLYLLGRVDRKSVV